MLGGAVAGQGLALQDVEDVLGHPVRQELPQTGVVLQEAGRERLGQVRNELRPVGALGQRVAAGRLQGALGDHGRVVLVDVLGQPALQVFGLHQPQRVG